MGITAKFTEKDVDKTFQRFLDAIEKRVIERFQMLGEMCVEHVKLLPPEIGFRDQTGNLRSSIGYVVFYKGTIVHGKFEQALSGSEGARTGRSLAESIGSRYPDDIVLVVVAGMNYALHVEARGKDVLASAEHLAQNELPKMMAALISNIQKATE